MTSGDKTTLHDDGSDTETDTTLAAIASTAPVEGGIGDYFTNYIQRIRGGDMGSLPAVGGLIALIVLFTIVQPIFHSRYNLGNMLTDGAGPVLLAMGLVFVLLLGEIDLSAGYAAGVCAFVMVRLMVGFNAPWPVSIGAALLTGVVMGFLIGWLRAKVRIPSFVVTLAFFLAFQGVALLIADWKKGPTGDVPITDKVVLKLASANMPLWSGWAMAALIVGGYAYIKISAQAGRIKQGLVGEPMSVMLVKIGSLAVAFFLFVFALNGNRALHHDSFLTNVNGHFVRVNPPKVEGIPYVVPLIVVLFVILTFLLSRTRYGRHVYAVGGNEEAARRAGIPVDRIRISVFMICSFMAAVGGIAIGSNVASVSTQNYGGNTLLLAVGAAVIGGTSLFGGKGRVLDALIGGAVVEVISNGMSDLIQGTNGASIQYIVTGIVLLLAAAVDALSRRRAGSTGLA